MLLISLCAPLGFAARLHDVNDPFVKALEGLFNKGKFIAFLYRLSKEIHNTCTKQEIEGVLPAYIKLHV